jgi:hypothetical protein
MAKSPNYVETQKSLPDYVLVKIFMQYLFLYERTQLKVEQFGKIG